MFTLALVASSALAGSQDFNLVNESGLKIDQLFISAHQQDTWGDDVLGIDVLENGNNVDITFAGDDSVCQWDIKVVQWGDNTAWTVSDVNLCGTWKLTFGFDGSTVTYTRN